MAAGVAVTGAAAVAAEAVAAQAAVVAVGDATSVSLLSVVLRASDILPEPSFNDYSGIHVFEQTWADPNTTSGTLVRHERRIP